MDKAIAIERIGRALFEQDVPDFGQFDCCIGLDIGGGNCSGAAVDLRPDKDHTPRQLKLSEIDETSLWSIIGYDALPGKEGKISIGKQAMNRLYQFSNYKKVPSNENLTLKVSPDNYKPTGETEADIAVRRSYEELNRDYIRILYQRILDHPENSGLGERDKTLVIVGHPSSDDWKSEEAHRNLARIVQEATGAACVLTTSESNAAILYALNALEGALGGAKNILIVDLGAFSGDITRIDRENLVRRYASMELGGKSIDRNIAQIILDNAHLKEEDLAERFNLIYEARRVKELFWPSGEEDVKIYVNATGWEKQAITKAQFNKAVTQMPISVTDPFTGDLRRASYTEHLSAFLEEAKTELGITQVDWVLVTGGAARMKPAMEVIRNKSNALWGVQQDHIWPSVIKDYLIDESVCFGNLYFYLKAQEVLDKIPGVYEELNKEAKEMISPMAEEISQGILGYLMPKVVESVLRQFRDTEEIRTIDKLEAKLQVELDKESHRKKIRKIIDEKATAVANDTKPKFQSIITNFLEALYGRCAGEAGWNWGAVIHPVTIDVASIINMIQDALSHSIMEEILSFILFTILLPVTVGFLTVAAVVESIAEEWREKYYTQEQKEQWEQNQQQKKADAENKRQQKEREERQKVRGKGEREKIYKKAMDDKNRKNLQTELKQKVAQELEQTWTANGFGVADAYLEQLTEDICKAVYTGL